MRHLTFGAVFVPLMAVVVTAVLAAAGGGARDAFACSGPGIAALWSDADLIFEGRILSAREDPEASDEYTAGVELRIQVSQGHKGIGDGDILAVQARVPKPQGFPLPCAGWDRNQDFEGKYVVAGLVGHTGGSRELGRWLTPFISDAPSGREYESASRWARVAAGADPTLPAIRISRTAGECGGNLTVVGSRFEPGSTVLVNYPGAVYEDDGRRPEVTVGMNGSFVRSFPLREDVCTEGSAYWFVEAYPADPNQQIGGYPLAFVPFDSAATVPGPPDTGNTVSEQKASGSGAVFAGAIVAATGSLMIALGARRRLAKSNGRP